MKKMMQTHVHSENDLGLHLRLQLRPHLVNLNKKFRKCWYDTNKNLIFNAKYFHMKQWCTNGTFQVYENLIVTLHIPRLFLILELGTSKPIFYHDSLKPLTPPPGPQRMILSFVFYTNIMLDTRFCCCHQYVVATNLNYFIEKVMSPRISYQDRVWVQVSQNQVLKF